MALARQRMSTRHACSVVDLREEFANPGGQKNAGAGPAFISLEDSTGAAFIPYRPAH